jgi:hypothetical protein
MYDIFGVPPHAEHEVKITTRDTEMQASAFARNLAGFGYTKTRVAKAGVRAEGPPPIEQENA